MGSAMAANTVGAGYTVIGYDVDAARVRDHVRAGGIAARSSADVRKRSDIVICSLPSAAALAQVAVELAESDGADVIVETSTMPIVVKVAAQQRLAKAGVTLLDCPLSGTGSQARVRDIVVYASGAESAYRRVAPVMDAFARAHYHVGPFGAGSKMKFVANLLVAIHNVAAAEGLVLAMKAGLDPALTLKVIADGGGSSRMLQVPRSHDGERGLFDSHDEAGCVAEGYERHRRIRKGSRLPDAALCDHSPHLPGCIGGRSWRRRYRRCLCRARRNGELQPSIGFTEAQRETLVFGQTSTAEANAIATKD